MKSKKLDPLLRDIEHYFYFLFEKGFVIYSVQELPMGDWRVTLALDNCGLIIYRDEGEISVVFSPIDSNLQFRVGLESMVYFLSNEQVFLGKMQKGLFSTRQKVFQKLAALVNEYIDQIIPYFGSDYEKHELELTLTQQKYLEIYLNRYLPKRKSSV